MNTRHAFTYFSCLSTPWNTYHSNRSLGKPTVQNCGQQGSFKEDSRMATPASAEAFVTVDVHATKSLIGSGHRYLDVRTVEEFNKGHVEGAFNIPYMFFTPEGRVKNPRFVEQVSAVCSKDDHLVVGCQSGVRSLGACSDLLKADFKNLKNVGGGYAAWVENGFAVKKPQAKL